MREFGITVTDALKQGLPPDRRAEARGDFVSQLVNIRPTRFGAEGVEHLSKPGGLYGREDWPFPQVFHGRRHTFVCERNGIFLVEPGYENQLDNVSPVRTIQWDTPNSDQSITEGGRWDFVDMGDAFYFYNGECVVFNLFERFGPNNRRAWINSDIPINCGTKFKGRNVFGGLGPSVFDHFTELLDEVSAAARNYGGQGLPFSMDLDEFKLNHVMWSSIGGGDFPAWLFWPQRLMGNFFGDADNALNPSWDDIRKKIKRNQLGWMEMPRRGKVEALEPLGNTGVIAYGDSYVTALLPTSGGGQDVPATFGKRHLLDVGLHSRDAIASGPASQVFLGDDGRLRLITGELEVNTLGYQQFLEDLHDVVVEYEPREEEFYISDGRRAFTLGSEGAFYEHERAVSSFETIQGKTVAALESTGNAAGLLTTSFIDFGQTGQKTVTQVDVDYRGPNTPYVAVAFRYNSEEPMQVTDWQALGPDNSVPIRVTAKEFKVQVYIPSYEGLEIDDLKIRFQLPDKRFVRGTRANPVNT